MQKQQGKNKGLVQPRLLGGLLLRLLFLYLSAALSAILHAQQTFGPTPKSDLPNSPGSQLPSPQSPATATISGTVRDINGGIVPDAKATLESLSGQPERLETADNLG